MEHPKISEAIGCEPLKNRKAPIGSVISAIDLCQKLQVGVGERSIYVRKRGTFFFFFALFISVVAGYSWRNNGILVKNPGTREYLKTEKGVFYCFILKLRYSTFIAGITWTCKPKRPLNFLFTESLSVASLMRTPLI